MKLTIYLAFAVVQFTFQPADVDPFTLTAYRVWTAAAVALALAGVVIGGLALRAAGRVGSGSGRKGAIVAIVAGLIAVVSGGLVLVTANGGPGTGNGVAGAVVALVLGGISTFLGQMGLTGSRRSG